MVYQYQNFGLSTTAEALDDTETGVDVVNAASFPTSGDFVINVEGELMLVTAVASNTFTVTRGVEGTAAVTHPIGATVKNVLTAGALQTPIEVVRFTDTGGNYTLNSTSWTNVGTTDLVVNAVEGDVLLCGILALCGAEAVTIGFDYATMVSGSPVNYVSGQTPTSTSFGFAYISNLATNLMLTAELPYTVAAGDISGGQVTLRLYYHTYTAANKTFYATTDYPLIGHVVNLG
jgi:hypothetical protein